MQGQMGLSRDGEWAGTERLGYRESSAAPRRTDAQAPPEAFSMPPGWKGNSRRRGGGPVSEWQWVDVVGRKLPDPSLTCQQIRQPWLLVFAGWEGLATSTSPLCGIPPTRDTSATCFWFSFFPSLPEELGRGPQSKVRLFLTAAHGLQDLSSPVDQGSNPCPMQWKRRVLIAGLPGRSPRVRFLHHH